MSLKEARRQSLRDEIEATEGGATAPEKTVKVERKKKLGKKK